MLRRSELVRIIFVALITLLPIAARAAEPVAWSSDLDAALARARSERKLILVHLRAACGGGGCNRSFDKFLQDAEAHEAIRQAYSHLILVRVDASSRSAAVQRLLEQKPARPSIDFVDPNGELIADRRDFLDINAYLNDLALFNQQADRFLHGADLAAAGKAGEAKIVLGDALSRVGATPEARDLFAEAAAEFKKEKNDERAEFARMYEAFTQYYVSEKAKDKTKRDRALSDLLRMASYTSSKANAADGFIAIGVIRTYEHDRRGAIRAFRRALELADPAGATAATARQQLISLGEQVADRSGNSAPLISLVTPARASITGRAEFFARVAPSIARVSFFLDNTLVKTADRAPFSARIDVGAVPRLRTIKAIAYDTAGNAVGETETTINDRVDVFRAMVVSPVGNELKGDVVIEADAKAPDGRHVQAMSIYWNEAKLATLTERPFRVNFTAPGTFGYVRAVATLDDGRTAEDTRVFNASGVTEAVDVHAVTFAATVVDANGRQVQGLTANDFVAKEEGTRVALTAVSDAEPALIGLAIDASTSMRSSLLNLFETATRFIDSAATPMSKLFVVAFDQSPRVIHSASSDRESLKKTVLELTPSGGTALLDAIAFALQQFNGVGGRKALVVITDGFDGVNGLDSKAATRMASQAGVPLYVIIPAANSGRSATAFGNALEGVTAATGGMVVHSPRKEELAGIFDRIRDEVQSQYLFSFTADASRPVGEWRRLTVDVPGRNVKVRTISGFYAR